MIVITEIKTLQWKTCRRNVDSPIIHILILIFSKDHRKKVLLHMHIHDHWLSLDVYSLRHIVFMMNFDSTETVKYRPITTCILSVYQLIYILHSKNCVNYYREHMYHHTLIIRTYKYANRWVEIVADVFSRHMFSFSDDARNRVHDTLKTPRESEVNQCDSIICMGENIKKQSTVSDLSPEF